MYTQRERHRISLYLSLCIYIYICVSVSRVSIGVAGGIPVSPEVEVAQPLHLGKWMWDPQATSGGDRISHKIDVAPRTLCRERYRDRRYLYVCIYIYIYTNKAN